MNDEMNIKDMLLTFRQRHSLTQKELAEILQIEPQSVSLYERGVAKGSKGHIFGKFSKKLREYELSKGISVAEEPAIAYTKSIVKPIENDIYKAIPFFKINVSAGNISFLDNGLIEGQRPDGYMFIPRNIDADIAFPTYGHSMHPEISNGDVVAYKLLKDMSFFNYGMKYLVVTDEQRMVKYIKRHKKEGYVSLESKNSDFGTIDMPINSIRYLLQVRYIGKTEM